MSQMTFGEPFGEAAVVPLLSDEEPKRSDSWYKGRVLSHSSLSTYQQCPQKWKFRYIEKIPQQPRSYFSFGKSVHTGLEFLFTKSKELFPSLEEVLVHYRENWLREGYETAIQEKWFFQEGERILRGFYAKHESNYKSVFQVEYKFDVELEGVPITGFIDRIDETLSGKLSLVDYKTGKPFDKTRVRKDPQLTLYQIACKKIFGKDIETVTLYHLNSLTALSVPAHSKALEDEYLIRMMESAKGISAENYSPKPDIKGYCTYCDYLQICPAFAGNKGQDLSRAAAPQTSDAVDRYGKLVQKINDLQEEKMALEEELKSHADRSGIDQLQGRHYTAYREKADDGPAFRIEEKKPAGEES